MPLAPTLWCPIHTTVLRVTSAAMLGSSCQANFACRVPRSVTMTKCGLLHALLKTWDVTFALYQLPGIGVGLACQNAAGIVTSTIPSFRIGVFTMS